MLKKLNSPSLRLFGVDHVALAWMAEDKEWTSEKGSQHNNLASKTVPLLDRAVRHGSAEGGAAVVRAPWRQAMAGDGPAETMAANESKGMQGGGWGRHRWAPAWGWRHGGGVGMMGWAA